MVPEGMGTGGGVANASMLDEREDFFVRGLSLSPRCCLLSTLSVACGCARETSG